MAIDYDRLMNWPFPLVEQTYTARDTILYALGIGLGAEPCDGQQLPFVYEEKLQVLPTMAVVLAWPGFWLKDPETGVDWVRVLHAGQGLEIHDTLPPSGTVVGQTRVTGIIDKGADKGALILTERRLYEKSENRLLATLHSTTFARGDGGFGGPRAASTEPPADPPDRAPDRVVDLPTLPQSALIYRLSGDWNPLHADPRIAREAGFEAPILHGLCTLGIAGHAILRGLCGYRANALKSLELRFSAPVYPGETVRTEMWNDGGLVHFRARCVERDLTILKNGKARIDG